MDPRRTLPSVDRVVSALAAEFPRIPRPLVADAARAAVESARRRGESGAAVEPEAVAAEARSRLTDLERSQLQPLVNATGVIIHTNLGRVPLGAETLEAVAAVAGAYSNLEYRLADGRRGGRRDHAGALLARACGAEAALVVNNNAAAVLVVLAVLARGRQVVVSRGQLVEIGGGFRVPEVLAESGAALVEVGTTNRTRLADYRRALGPETAMLLVVHPSNYRMVGFVESTPVSELAGLGPPVVVDAGSGLLDETTPWLGRRPGWLAGELGVRQCLDAGAALVTFSGDKLLGGPQAGVIAGRAELVDAVSRHPLARAVRADKMTLAALSDVACAYLDGDAARLPLWRMATAGTGELRDRAAAIAADVPGAKVLDTDAVAGGGSLPGLVIPSAGVAVEVADADAAMAALREQGVVARVEAGSVVCDLRTVDPRDDVRLGGALRASTARGAR